MLERQQAQLVSGLQEMYQRLRKASESESRPRLLRRQVDFAPK